MGDELRGDSLVHLNVRFSTEAELKQTLDFLYVKSKEGIPNCGREKNLNVVLTNASGFGGLHAAMILKKYID